MWAAATPRRSGTPGPTPSRSGTRSSSRSSGTRTGAGAMSTKPTCEEAAETPDLQGAFPRLSDEQIAALDAQGWRQFTRPGDVLFAEGDRECDFFVVLAGKVASVEGHGTPEERVIAVHGRGRFLGELSLLTGEGSYYTAVALDAGEVLGVPVSRLRDLVDRDPA